MFAMRLPKMTIKYRNHGQEAERRVAVVMGFSGKANNTPWYKGGDVMDFQVKSARATICKGTDYRTHIAQEPVRRYIYVIADYSKMVVMTKAEYIDFIDNFGTTDLESKGNGGAVKTRLKSESKAMLEWLGV